MRLILASLFALSVPALPGRAEPPAPARAATQGPGNNVLLAQQVDHTCVYNCNNEDPNRNQYAYTEGRIDPVRGSILVAAVVVLILLVFI